jgi:hypothetical protein
MRRITQNKIDQKTAIRQLVHSRTLTMMEQHARLAPFIWPELPHLARREDAHNSVPRVSAELVQCFDRIDDVIPLRACARLAARLDRGALAIDRYEVFCFRGTLGG